VPWLDDASRSFFVFLGQEDIFIGSGACLLCGGCVGCSGGVCGSGARARPLIKPWTATARAAPRSFAINADAEAQALLRRSAASI
jgi:hypothetical protein